MLSRQIELNAALDLNRTDEVFADDSKEMAAADTDVLGCDNEAPDIEECEME